MGHKVAAVVVLYHPDHQVIETIQSLSVQVENVVVVINAASDEVLKSIKKIINVALIQNSSNIGLATALNKGLEYSFGELQADFVQLFDQDSNPPLDFTQQLLQEFINSKEFELACIGPKLIDLKGGDSKYEKNNSQVNIQYPRSIPTSGTLISKEAFTKVGAMMDALFIDGIDHEWCFRAYSKGLVVKVSDAVQMEHNMGDVGLNYFGQYKPIHQSSVRHYFIVRNAIYLSFLSYIPLSWRMVELIKTIRRIFVYAFVSTNRLQSIRLMVKAICDGVCKKLGPIEIAN